MDYWHFSRAAENWRSQEHEKENAMLIHDDVFSWQGFGGLFNLAAGRCRLRIFDLAKDGGKKVAFLKSVIVVVSEPADKENGYKQVSVRSCCSHIASCVADRFGIDPHRMIFIEYYPASTYGDQTSILSTPNTKSWNSPGTATKPCTPSGSRCSRLCSIPSGI